MLSDDRFHFDNHVTIKVFRGFCFYRKMGGKGGLVLRTISKRKGGGSTPKVVLPHTNKIKKGKGESTLIRIYHHGKQYNVHTEFIGKDVLLIQVQGTAYEFISYSEWKKPSDILEAVKHAVLLWQYESGISWPYELITGAGHTDSARGFQVKERKDDANKSRKPGF